MNTWMISRMDEISNETALQCCRHDNSPQFALGGCAMQFGLFVEVIFLLWNFDEEFE